MDTSQEMKIYRTYRRALKSINKVRPGRAHERRNAARKITVNQHNIPFADLKTIIARFDAIEGIIHEQQDVVKAELELKAAQAAFDANPTVCACGSDDLVRPRFNKVAFEKNGSYVIETTCYMCHR